MKRYGKQYRSAAQKREKLTYYTLTEALALVKTASFTKFVESVDIAVKLNVDPRHADQMVRGTVLLPHGTGKVVRVLVFAKGEEEKQAREAGADFVGAEDLVEKIQGGWTDFDVAIAAPDMMPLVGKLGKILGPRGLMPNPKVGTVTKEIGRAVNESKGGKIQFRVDKSGNIHAPIGKVNFDTDKLFENAKSLLDTLVRLKPAAVKGTYIKNITVSSTMGPGVKVDLAEVVKA